jgi:hypothetical protein
VPPPRTFAAGDEGRLPDGSVVLWNKEPEACARCGIVPEFIVKVILSVVGGPNRPEERLSGTEER